MVSDVKDQSIQCIHNISVFPIQLDDIIDITSLAQSMYFVRYLGNICPGRDVAMWGLAKPFNR